MEAGHAPAGLRTSSWKRETLSNLASSPRGWPTLELAQRARDKTLLDFFHAHNVRSRETVDRRIAAIREEQPLTTDAAVIGPARLLVEVLVPQLRAVSRAVRRFDEEIERLCGELADDKLFRALPGAGPVFAARLLWPSESSASASRPQARSSATPAWRP